MRRLIRAGSTLACAAAGLAWFNVVSASQEFSADLIGIDADGKPARGRLYVASDRVRIDSPEVPTGYFLFNTKYNTAYFVRPDQRIFMDAKQSSLLAQLFTPVDPEMPCEGWQARARLSGAADDGGEWRCEDGENENIGQRNASSVNATSPRRLRYLIWIDKRYGFPLRVRAEDGSAYGLQNIEEKPQPDSLFAVPAGYAKFDPRTLIERLKQSDVWVEPPH